MAILGWDRTEGPRRSGSVSPFSNANCLRLPADLMTPGNMIFIWAHEFPDP